MALKEKAWITKHANMLRNAALDKVRRVETHASAEKAGNT